MDCVGKAASDSSNLQVQHTLMLKQRELGQSVQRVVLCTTTESTTRKVELQQAVDAMATASGASITESNTKGVYGEDAQIDNITVMAAAQEAIHEIDATFSTPGEKRTSSYHQ